MKALSISRPWPVAFMRSGGRLVSSWGPSGVPRPKRIENRGRSDGKLPAMCHYRGPLLLHAAKSWDPDATKFMLSRGLISGQDTQEIGTAKRHSRVSFLQPGVIFAQTRVIGHIASAEGRAYVDGRPPMRITAEWPHIPELRALGFETDWWTGGDALIFGPVRVTPAVPCRGYLDLWRVPEEAIEELERQGTFLGGPLPAESEEAT